MFVSFLCNCPLHLRQDLKHFLVSFINPACRWKVFKLSPHHGVAPGTFLQKKTANKQCKLKRWSWFSLLNERFKQSWLTGDNERHWRRTIDCWELITLLPKMKRWSNTVSINWEALFSWLSAEPLYRSYEKKSKKSARWNDVWGQSLKSQLQLNKN